MSAPPTIAPPVAALFPGREACASTDALLTVALADAYERIATGPVNPTLDAATFRAEIERFDFVEPWALDDVLQWAISRLEQGATHMTHPRYFGLFNPAPSFPSQCAERIVSALNPQLASATTSPIPVEIERHVIAAIGRRAGFSEQVAGHFTSGGSEANFTATLCALTHANPRYGAEGVFAFPARPVFYISNESHLAWIKIAHEVGIGRDAVRLVATDGSGRMSLADLRRLIASDRAQGCLPFMVVATAGTTNAGMIDPLVPCADLCRAEGLWYHVDAAWGGAALASDRLRPLLAGIERADSFIVDAHKWFATTMGCGMFVTRHVELLSETFQVTTTFMPSNTRTLDPYVTTAQWSRRFLGLRMFVALAVAGWRGYAEHVERSVDLMSLLEADLVRRGWTIANRSSLAVAAIEPPQEGPDVAAIVADLVRSGHSWVAAAKFEGRPVIRACLTHGQTLPEHVAELASALDATRLRLAGRVAAPTA